MKIKNINKVFLIGSLFLITGCSKFLDKQPNSILTEDKYYRNTNEVETGVLGCYGALRDLYNDDPVLAGLRSDDAFISDTEGDINQIDNFGETPNNSYVSSYWQEAYYVIKQCNTVLKYLNNVTDSTKKSNFEGEVRFLRGHVYFNLVRLFGDVPLVLKSVDYTDTASFKRIARDSVYKAIINDLTIAIQQLPATSNPIQTARVNSYAAKGMLAKVYMTLKNYLAARPLLTDLIKNPGQYQLLPSYKSVFGVNNEMNPEIMYAVRYTANSNGSGNTFTYFTDKFPGSPGFRAASDFRNSPSFTTGDSIRKSQTFLYGGAYGSSYYCGGKYQDPGSIRYDGGADFIVLRYADIILLYAENENEILNTPLVAADVTNTNSRLYQLNRIRNRACGNYPNAVPPFSYNSITINSPDSFRVRIRDERRRELGEEDQRWYDLLRWGNAVSAMNLHFQKRASATFIPSVVLPYQTLYPIPQREIDVSGHILTQNPGY